MFCLTLFGFELVYSNRFLIAPIGLLDARLRTLDSVTGPPINMSRQFSAHISAKSPLNISPNSSEVVCEVSEP